MPWPDLIHAAQGGGGADRGKIRVAGKRNVEDESVWVMVEREAGRERRKITLLIPLHI